ncbi:MAG: ribosome biogenesis GTP-binding protein YihA/YsxC [Thermodesulfobacteriota bacterium]
MKIKSTVFLKSGTDISHCPGDNLPEVILIGRSNVGKSSLINTLLNRRGFAKTSSTPGKTRTLNFYEINGRFRFVDLPGYGFAKVSKQLKREWQRMVERYVTERRNLKGALVVLDARREPGEIETLIYPWLESEKVPARTVVTKADKLSKNRLSTQVRTIKSSLPVDDLITFSAVTREGRTRLWHEIEELIEANSS